MSKPGLYCSEVTLIVRDSDHGETEIKIQGAAAMSVASTILSTDSARRIVSAAESARETKP